MRKFEVLFDHGEPSPVENPAYGPYGNLGFPDPPPDRPWIYSNFVQSLDGIVSFKGKHAAGSDISHSDEDRWLMDLLRAHADAVLLGANTLIDETQLGNRERGPVFRIMSPDCRELRQRLGRGRERNIIVTGSASLDLGDYRVFDGELADAAIVTTRTGAKRLAVQQSHPHVRILTAGDDTFVNLSEMARILRRELGIRYLLCEGGPTLYGYMSKARLIDEKFVTVSPIEVGQRIPPEQEPTESEKKQGVKVRPTTFDAPGFTVETMPWWTWVSCRRIGDHQFSRYRRR
jgi:riboflavin biosynthesis pyrimidine reductase